MSKKLFVGSLAWATDNAGLRAAFEAFGEVTDAVVITDRDTGRSRGFGFVTFADNSEAEQAIQEMHGAELDGRTLEVNEARERAPRSNGGGGRSFRGGGGGGGGGGDRRGGSSPKGRRRERNGGRRKERERW